MIKSTGRNLSFYWGTLFFRELYQQGLRHVIISPGSRSTPLTLAAAAFPDLQKHVILDERSAGFTALGIGKTTGIPAALICTSGTATANYYPAVVEACQSGVPLLLATADRPDYLRNTDANQTIDQIELYGKFVRSFVHVGEPDGSEDALSKLKRKAQYSFEQAVYFPGPVHLNFPFEKPLEPETNFIADIQRENEELCKQHKKIKQSQSQNSFQLPDHIYDVLKQSQKPLIMLGQLAVNRSNKPIFELAETLRVPVLSEQGFMEGDTTVQGFEGFLRNAKTRLYLEPDVILRFGLQPASKSLLKALESWNPKHHIYFTNLSDPRETSLSVSEKVLWDGNNFLMKNMTAASEDWLGSWKDTGQKYATRKIELMKALNGLTDGHVYEYLSAQIPNEWSIFFSNSFPARDRSMFGSWSVQSVYTNRGASGIDGITSTAIGVGIGTDKPGLLFTGDLAFLHDTNALLNEKLLTKPLIVVVINNRGGSIFRMLPIADYQPYFTDYFETPQQADLSKLAGSYGLYFQRISTLRELKDFDLLDFVEKSHTGKKLLILEFQTDPDVSMELRKQLWGDP